jgi:hypothetical protein
VRDAEFVRLQLPGDICRMFMARPCGGLWHLWIWVGGSPAIAAHDSAQQIQIVRTNNDEPQAPDFGYEIMHHAQFRRSRTR